LYQHKLLKGKSVTHLILNPPK